MNLLLLAWHFVACMTGLMQPRGLKSIAAENLLLRQQLIVARRSRKRSPPLTTQDRLIFALLAQLIPISRLRKVAITVKPATLLNFHRSLVRRKYQRLFSAKSPAKPGPKGPPHKLIKLVVEIKQNNPRMGYDRIAMQVYQAFGISIDKQVVRRILAKHYKPVDPGGPSWLTFLGQFKDSLWSIDLLRCESINLKSYWVMVAIDIHTRRLVGIATHEGSVDGFAACAMFNQIRKGQSPPRWISTDHDPIFNYHRWKANLRILDIEEIKTVPYCPRSHPFVERVIGTIRRELLDQTLFWSQRDLNRKLTQYQTYYNNIRGHLPLTNRSPAQAAAKTNTDRKSLGNYRWESHCNGLFKTPIAC